MHNNGHTFTGQDGTCIQCNLHPMQAVGWDDGTLCYGQCQWKPQTPTEAPATANPPLPITLTAESPEPPYGSVVLGGPHAVALQRRAVVQWQPVGSAASYSWRYLIRDFTKVVLIYVPPKTETPT